MSKFVTVSIIDVYHSTISSQQDVLIDLEVCMYEDIFLQGSLNASMWKLLTDVDFSRNHISYIDDSVVRIQ